MYKYPHRLILLVLVFSFGIQANMQAFAKEKAKIVSLHPIISDLAQSIAGDKLEILDIVKDKNEIHDFSPSPSDLVKISTAKLILASGKFFESYLNKIKLTSSQKIIRVGDTVPSITIATGKIYMLCPTQDEGAIDPHWWHSPNNMQRAARLVFKEFCKIDPENKDIYSKNLALYDDKIKELRKWIRLKISLIPHNERILVSTHAAFSYFCRDFGFASVPIQGTKHEKEPTAKYIVNIIKIIRKYKIKAIFPENNSNPKILTQIAQESGAKISKVLISDGTFSKQHKNINNYEQMMKYNVNVIVNALMKK